MQIFGHPWIESESFYKINSIEDISKTPANSLLHIENFSTSLELLKYCQENSLRYALDIGNIKEAILSNRLGATFILCEKNLAVELMPIAQNYLFDTHVLAYVDEEEIEEMARAGVDGVKLT